MDEKGYGPEIASAIVLLAILFSMGLLTSSWESTFDLFNSARKDRNKRFVNEVQTDLRVENVVYYQADEDMEIIAKNTGSIELDSSKIDVFVDGDLISKENIENRLVDGSRSDVWIPEDNLVIITENVFPTTPNRVKLVSEFGISDYSTDVEVN